jgi:hypothetical protein
MAQSRSRERGKRGYDPGGAEFALPTAINSTFGYHRMIWSLTETFYLQYYG